VTRGVATPTRRRAAADPADMWQTRLSHLSVGNLLLRPARMSAEGMVLDAPYDLWRHLLRPHKRYKTQSRLKTRRDVTRR
jgi:hypothetical protein